MKYLALTCLGLMGAAACDRPGGPITLHEVTVTGDRRLAETTVTAGQQPMGEADANVVRDVRRAVMAEEGLSMSARNVQIIAIDGVVTLRGSVHTDRERDIVERLARAQPNVTRVENALEVSTQ